MNGKINEDFIFILKFRNENKRLEIDYLPIENQLENEFKDFIKQINSNIPIKNILKKFVQFNFLLGWFSYAEHISSPYQGVVKYLDFARLKKMLSGQKDEILNLVDTLKLRIKAHKIEKAYEAANSLIDKGQALAFSHRRVGWTAKPFELSEEFKIQFNTNFGYGSVGYFYLVVEYKNVIIIPYSDWIVYRFSAMYEIQRYTRKYVVEHESWLKAMDDCELFYNLSVANEKKFVDTYIINEAKKMVDGLKQIMKYQDFKLLQLNNDEITLKLEGYKIIEYRGEKVSGALQFISHLMNFNEYDEIKQMIKEIKDINLELLPILKIEYELISKRIKEINPEYLRLKPIVERLREEHRKILKRKNEILNELSQECHQTDKRKKKDINLGSESDKLLSEEMPDWKERTEKYFETHNKYFNPIEQELGKLLPFNEKINSSIREIERYFSES